MKLIGLDTCSRCKMAKTMLEKRNIPFEYQEAKEQTDELPILVIDEKVFKAKDVLLEIRKLK